MTKFFVCDIYAHSSEHSMFVESFIDYFESNSDVAYLLNETHSKYIKSNHKVFKFFIKDTFCKSPVTRLFNREIVKSIRLLLLLPYIILSKRKLVVLGTSNIQTYLLSFLKFLSFIHVSVIFHSQLESLVKEPSERRRFGGIFIKSFKSMHDSKVFNILVLGEHIKENLQQLGFSNVSSIPHPIPKASLLDLKPKRENIDLKHHIAMVGLIRNDAKNCNKIYDLKMGDSVHAHVIGRAKPDFKIIKKDNITFTLWNDIYTEEQFVSEVDIVDSFIYFFSEDDYKLTASATALDAIIYGKAVFSLRNRAVSSLLKNYPLFFEFDTVEEMSDAINKFDLNLLHSVDFNSQREEFLIQNFEGKLKFWLHQQ
ncbi:hypothetical protein [Vibrio sp. M60_M70]|uniref:hypothetical protein n=1 Tax=Vibrio sp. M60_M70 TaxID=3035166 RepID=UPI00301DAF04